MGPVHGAAAPLVCFWIAVLLMSSPIWGAPRAATDEATLLDRAMAAAEASLRAGQPQAAERHYRTALVAGWLLMGTLETVERRLPEARDAFRSAAGSAAENRRALHFLALAHLQLGETAQAVDILTRLAGEDPKDVPTRRLLAQALIGAGQPEQAVRQLEEAHATAPDDLELAYALASGYLRLKKTDDAARVFARIAAARPIAPTHVLIGRAYSDADELDRARAHLRTALKLDPRVRRAHYYLGLLALAEGMTRLDQAIAEFREELKTAPDDTLASVQLGMALVESRRHAEALPALERAARSEPPQARAFYFLGRSLLGLDRAAEAVASLRRALKLAGEGGASQAQLGSIHNHLGLALRKLGAMEEAAPHFAEAERLSARGAEAARDALARYQADAPDAGVGATAGALLLEGSPLSKLTPAERADLRRRVTPALAGAYLNLGVMEAQGERFVRAAELFEKAAGLAPELPRVQRSLGVARFNAKEFDQATGPLARALAEDPGDAGLKRMLALSWLNTQAYGKAAELLGDDPERRTDPSLEFAYGLALVNSGRGKEAEAVFSGLLARGGDSPELNVVLGKAHAQEGDFDQAIRSLTRALQLQPDVAEANATLGVVYLKLGRLEEAEAALRAELKVRPGDVKSRQDLAMVLDLTQRPEEALRLLRGILASEPDLPDARYLLGKVLLAQGAATEAVEHLEAAARLAPEDPNVRYQLGRAYQKLGRAERAEQQFEIFRRIKAQR